MKRMKSFLLLICLSLSILSYAQVTTSSMSGIIIDDETSLAGATVIAVHEPSGTTYGAVSNLEGRYSIQGMRTGGPYQVKISYIGYADHIEMGVHLSLGENYILDVKMVESDAMLSEVVVTAVGSKFSRDKNGSMTNVNNRQMSMIPTLNRSISDYTKLSPYASGTGSFGGRPAYATNITIDGANFNNNFGLNTNSMPGPSAGSADPISMDAIEEMQIAVAPYDVRQSNFTGAGINVITKSGTNEFKGSAYFLYRNQDMNGTKMKDEELKVNDSSKEVYGLTIGGPIIKNKLFFFVSGEIENNLTPGNTLLALNDNRSVDDPNVSNRVKASDLEAFSRILKDKYGYNTGKYENWGGDNENSKKLLAKIDWNISQNHKATVRYNYSKASSISRPSSSGDARPSISGGRHSKSGGMSFENSQYRAAGTLHSITGELNSQFGRDFSNKFLVAYTNYNQPREYDGGLFPFIDIMNNDASTAYMSAGTELFTYGNSVKNNTLILTNNVSYNLGNHNITGGVSYENQYLANGYLRQGSSYYRFKNLSAFENYISGDYLNEPWSDETHPMSFAYTYPINGNKESLAELTFGQFAAYLQDEWSMLPNFKLTYGLRIDLPMYLDGAIDNPELKKLDSEGNPMYAFRNGETLDLSSWPKTRVLWSPRLGFTYDINRDIKMRGGIGVFTGRIPFVWFVNQPQNSGMLQYQLVINQSTGGENAEKQLSRIPFTPNPSDLLKNQSIAEIFPQENLAQGRIACIDKNFKLPQVMRTSLAFDFKLPYDFGLTVEGILTKDINAIRFENINLADAESAVKEGDVTRPYWSNSYKYITPIDTYTDVVMMRNTNKGMGYSFSAQLSMPEISGFSGMVAYTYSYAEEVTGKNGSDPFSAWQYRHVSTSLNSEEVGLTMNNTPHRIIASASYRIDYAKNFRSTFSLFYNGYKGGAYSYIYANDANKDGSVSDLMYIPEKKADFIWKDVSLGNGKTANSWDLYQKLVANDSYLSDNAGSYAERYAAYEPFYNRIDFRFLQDFYLNVGGRKHTLQFSLDILNIPNMLNSDWGINKIYVGSNQQVTPLRFEGIDAETGKAIVSMNNVGTSSNPRYLESPFQMPTSVSALWNLQLGIRYIF